MGISNPERLEQNNNLIALNETFDKELEGYLTEYLSSELPSNNFVKRKHIKLNDLLHKPTQSQSLPSLPKLNTNFEEHLIESELNEESQVNPVSIGEALRVEKDLTITGTIAEEYKGIRESYGNLIYMFEDSIKKDLSNQEANNVSLENYEFETLEDFENAMECGDFKVEEYDVKEINSLIKELTDLEDKMRNRDLRDFKIRNIGEFQRMVDKGILDLNNYNTKEISEFLSELDDEPVLTLNDYSITIYGDVILKDIETIIENNPTRSRRIKSETIKKSAEKTPANQEIPSLPNDDLLEEFGKQDKLDNKEGNKEENDNSFLDEIIGDLNKETKNMNNNKSIENKQLEEDFKWADDEDINGDFDENMDKEVSLPTPPNNIFPINDVEIEGAKRNKIKRQVDLANEENEENIDKKNNANQSENITKEDEIMNRIKEANLNGNEENKTKRQLRKERRLQNKNSKRRGKKIMQQEKKPNKIDFISKLKKFFQR